MDRDRGSKILNGMYYPYDIIIVIIFISVIIIVIIIIEDSVNAAPDRIVGELS